MPRSPQRARLDDVSGLTHDTAARLVGETPAGLEALVKAGAVRRQDRNEYSLPILVQDYVGHLKAEQERRILAPKQAEIAAHLDLSDRSVREFLSGSGIDQRTSTLDEIRVAYIRTLREAAAGRAAAGDLDLAAERAGLARAQRERIEMQNSVTRGELAPVAALEEVLAKAGSRVAGILDAIPGMVRRRVASLSAADVDLIATEIAKARNLAAALRLSDLDDEPASDAADEPVVEAD